MLELVCAATRAAGIGGEAAKVPSLFAGLSPRGPSSAVVMFIINAGLAGDYISAYLRERTQDQSAVGGCGGAYRDSFIGG